MPNAGRPQPDVMSNPRADRVRDVARLAGRPARLKRGRFLVEGPQAVREAVAAHRRQDASGLGPVVTEVYATVACLERFPELTEPLDGVELRTVTDDVLTAMADTVTPQGVVAVCHFVHKSLDEVLAAKPRLLAVMVQVRDPGNAGTILRAADSAGADAVIMTASSVDVYNPKAVRSTVGSLFHLPIVIGVELEQLTQELAQLGITVLAADGYAALDLDELQDHSAGRRLGTGDNPGAGVGAGAEEQPWLENPTAWLFGNEAKGLSDVERDAADFGVAVPVYGAAESLNVGTAATVCLYASARAQRRRAVQSAGPLFRPPAD